MWDAGANAGLTAYFFSQMVGPTGRVIAFEPDETNYEFLLRNIELHKLENVVPVKAAVSDTTGTATFCMDGTMSAGLTKTLAHSDAEKSRMVETLSPEDACARFGGVPRYIKMDIEGAELSVVAACKDLLKAHPVHLVIESNHVVDGKYTARTAGGDLQRDWLQGVVVRQVRAVVYLGGAVCLRRMVWGHGHCIDPSPAEIRFCMLRARSW